MNTCQQCVWRSKETKKSKIKIKQLQDHMIKGIEDRINEDIKNLFEQEEGYYKSARVIFIATVLLNMKIMVIKIKPYQSKNTLMKLNHT